MAYRKTNKVEEKQLHKKKAIIKAGKEMLAEEGYQQVSIKSLAEKAGIATGTFYLYFSNKDKLVESIADEMYEKLIEEIREERSKYTSVFDKLQASMSVCIRIFASEKQFAKILLIQAPGISKILNLKLVNIEKELVRLTKIDLDELMKQGLIPQQDTLISACAFVGTFRQVIISWLREGEPRDLEKSLETLLKYNLRGLGKHE